LSYLTIKVKRLCLASAAAIVQSYVGGRTRSGERSISF
jgi:hypothetical protein